MMMNLVIIKVNHNAVCLLIGSFFICYCFFVFAELAHLDYAYRNLIQYKDNESSVFEKLLEHDHGALLLINDHKAMMEHCAKHNIRKINIRSLSELLVVNNSVRCSSTAAQKYSWITYFNSDYTFSTSKFLANIKKPEGNRIKAIKSLREQLLKRMMELDNSLYEASNSYRGQLLIAYAY